MSDRSVIEWTEATWNPTTGCDRVSPGCDNCYALTLAKRLKAMGAEKYQNDGDPRTSGPGFDVTLHPDALNVPYWVIAGGESGPGHRALDEAWVTQIRDTCQDAGVAFFFKQWGGRTPKAGGRLLEGRTWDQMPLPVAA
ncbi:DUF5131 family protein [Streptomyces sp. NPDC001843]|uniref:DUF5131 family protein n=1 Tax=Streptomyces sp. NPDC001843 TaxID=3364617 RepID=UPI0036CA577E